MEVKCDSCGKVLEIGSYPFCPHGKGLGMLGEFKPYWEENLGPEPVYITSLAQKQNLYNDKDGSRGYKLVDKDLSVRNWSDARDRLMARREQAQKLARERA